MTESASGGITRDNPEDCPKPGRASHGSGMILHWLAVPNKHGQGQGNEGPRNYQNEERAERGGVSPLAAGQLINPMHPNRKARI